jgi:hypothetical protein
MDVKGIVMGSGRSVMGIGGGMGCFVGKIVVGLAFGSFGCSWRGVWCIWFRVCCSFW